MRIGRRIYYDKLTGDVIQDTGERQGNVTKTTAEQDIQVYKSLSDRVPASFDYVELEYGQFFDDFIKCGGYRINTNTKTVEFSYLDNPVQEPIYHEPLSVQFLNLENTTAESMVDLDFRLSNIELGL